NHVYSCWPHGRGLDNDLTVFRPDVVGRFRWFGIERAGGIRFHLAFVPLFADTEIQRTRQDDGGAPLVGMPMRHDFGPRWKLSSLNVHTRFSRITVQYTERNSTYRSRSSPQRGMTLAHRP